MANFLQDAWDAGVRTWDDLIGKLDEYKDEAQGAGEDAVDAMRNKARELSDSGTDFPDSQEELKDMFKM